VTVALRVEIECGKERCVVSNKRCRYLTISGYSRKKRCFLFNKLIDDDETFASEYRLRRCDACKEAQIK